MNNIFLIILSCSPYILTSHFIFQFSTKLILFTAKKKFIKKLKNYQAETKAEVINLYDEYLHRENLKNLQQEAIENQLEAQYRHELRMQGFQQDLQQRLNDVRENLEDAIESEQNRHQAGQDEIMDKLNEMNSKHR